MISIYVLSEKNNPDIVRYVGITTKSLSIRLSSHIYDSKYPYKNNKHKNNWIKKHKNNILITEIDSTDNLKDAYELEKKYIKLFKSCGAKLLNLTDGGETLVKWSEDRKKQVSKIYKNNNYHLRLHSKEAIEKMKISKTGIKHSEETKLKIGLKSKGRIHTDNTKIKISEKVSKPIQYFTKNMDLIGEFKSARDAEKYGFNYKCISRAINKCVHYKNFVWKLKIN